MLPQLSSSPSRVPHMPAQTIERAPSRYRITGRLGTGGMGVVYEAEDTRLRRHVALKFLPSQVARDPDARRRLAREAEIMAALSHPHICTIYDVDQHLDRACIVMERLDGTNLREYMLGRTLETSAILDIALQITEALEMAHAQGIVHGDIKPGNIMISGRGLVKVLDFGLAKPFSGVDMGDASLDRLTFGGRLMGTVNYMAPERILEMPTDPRSDLFALGVVMYQMATGILPFAGDSVFETAMNVLDADPVPLTSHCPQRSRSLERLVTRLLAKQPDRRYRSAAELRDVLRRIGSRRLQPACRTNRALATTVTGGCHDSISDSRLTN